MYVSLNLGNICNFFKCQ